MREAQAGSTEGDDLDENEVAVGLTNSGGVPGSSVRERGSKADREPIEVICLCGGLHLQVRSKPKCWC